MPVTVKSCRCLRGTDNEHDSRSIRGTTISEAGEEFCAEFLRRFHNDCTYLDIDPPGEVVS